MTLTARRKSLSSRKLLWLFACGVYITAMFIGTHVPLDMRGLTRDNNDKLLHFAGYAGLGFLVATGLLLRTTRRGQFVWASLAILLWAWVDELTQPFVGRTADIYDWLADAAGCSVGMLVAWTLVRLFRAPPRRVVPRRPALDGVPAMESESA
uniref:VanZ-like domain-containing protein n=1 Tax=Schlesneria paludicola TaxID=360056 RepID=A0A7C2K0X2_9PLAN